MFVLLLILCDVCAFILTNISDAYNLARVSLQRVGMISLTSRVLYIRLRTGTDNTRLCALS